jgi:hypothetical protein
MQHTHTKTVSSTVKSKMSEGMKDCNEAIARLKADPNNLTVKALLQRSKDWIEKNKSTWQK